MAKGAIMQDLNFAHANPSGLSKDSVERLAESVANQLGYEPGGDIAEIVKKLGGSIDYKDFWDENTDSGSTEIRSEGNFTIYLSWDTSQTRDRFTMAHELGHYIVHYLWPNKQGANTGPVKAMRYGSDRAEWEANWFAAAFLMPKEKFRKEFANCGADLNVIASIFGVSVMAAKIRAESLGLA
jgi:Zn-dependent peptidase ImmA (M78 family)